MHPYIYTGTQHTYVPVYIVKYHHDINSGAQNFKKQNYFEVGGRYLIP